MFFTFLTVVSTVAIIASVAYKYLEIKARTPLNNDDVIELQREIQSLKKRLENVEAILIAEENEDGPLLDQTELTESSDLQRATKKRNRSNV